MGMEVLLNAQQDEYSFLNYASAGFRVSSLFSLTYSIIRKIVASIIVPHNWFSNGFFMLEVSEQPSRLAEDL